MNTAFHTQRNVLFAYKQKEPCPPLPDVFMQHCYEIHYFHRGQGTYWLNHQMIHVKTGTLLLMDGSIKEEDRMCTNFSDHCVSTRFLFDPAVTDMLHQALMINHPLKPFLELSHFHLHLSKHEMEEIESAMTRLNALYKQSTAVSQHRFLFNFLDLLMCICRLCEPALEKKLEATDKEKYVQQTIDFIEANYMENIRLEQIEAHLHVSKHHLTKIFREATGMTIFDYLYQTRINRAMLLFHRNKELSVTDVCYEVGFKNPAHFSRWFKKQTGMSPDRYRKTL